MANIINQNYSNPVYSNITNQNHGALKNLLSDLSIDVTLGYPLPSFKELMNLNKPLELKISPLELARKNNDSESMKVLLGKVDFDNAEQRNRTFKVFTKAIKEDQAEIVNVFRNLIDSNINNINAKGLKNLLSALPIDVTLGYPLPSFKELRNLNKPLKLKTSPLELAYINDDPESMQVLLEKVDFKNPQQVKRVFKVFIQAIKAGRSDIVDVFLDSDKIDILQKDNHGKSFATEILKAEYEDLAQLKNCCIQFDSATPLLNRRRQIIASIVQKVLDKAPDSTEVTQVLCYQNLYNSI